MPGTEFARSYRGRRAGKGQHTPAAGRAGAGIFRLGEGGGDGRDWEGRDTGDGRSTGQREGDEFPTEDDNFELGDWIPALEAQSNMTPLPGYLSTPSKRAARARAMVRGGVGGLGGIGGAGEGGVGANAGMGGGSGGAGGFGGIERGSTTPATPRTARTIPPTRTPLTRRVPATEGRMGRPVTEGLIRRTPLTQGHTPRNELGRSVFGRSARGSLAVGFADIAEGESRTPE